MATRHVVLDTETTGFDPETGDRIVELACTELVNLIPTRRALHLYFNPHRPMPDQAFAVHGLGDEFLATQRDFSNCVDEFLAFIADSTLVIHNAEFDLKFLNFELGLVGLPPLALPVVDTLAIARQRFVGANNTLDGLCKRFGVYLGSRTVHGALIDCELLGEVYLHLEGGRQSTLLLGETAGEAEMAEALEEALPMLRREWPRRPAKMPSVEEMAAHEAFLDGMKKVTPVWRAAC